MISSFGEIPLRQHGQNTPLVFKLRQEQREGINTAEANVGLSVIGFDLVPGPVTDEPNGSLVPTYPHVEVASPIGPRGGIAGSFKVERLPYHNLEVQNYCRSLEEVPDAIEVLLSQEVKAITFAGNAMLMSVMSRLREQSKANPRARSFGVLLNAALSHLWNTEG